MHDVIQGIIVLIAVIVFLGGTKRAENKAHPVLRAARAELLGDNKPWYGHPLKRVPPMGKLEQHPNYPRYAAIYRREQKQVLKQIGVSALIASVLILISRL